MVMVNNRLRTEAPLIVQPVRQAHLIGLSPVTPNLSAKNNRLIFANAWYCARSM